MGESALCTLGLGVVLAWMALPMLAKLARRCHAAEPSSYYRALVSALLIAAAMFFVPWVREATAGALSDVRTWHRSWVASDTLRLAAVWAEPFVGESASAWPASPVGRLFSLLATLYLLFIAAGLGRFFVARAKLLRVCRAAEPAPPDVRERAEAMALGLGIVPPKLVVSDATALPFATGFFRPAVVLPRGLLARASEEELDFVLRHELVHVARGDVRAALAIGIARHLFTFHPVASPLVSEIALAREASVDAHVAADAPLQYAKFLVELAEHVQLGPSMLASSVPMADSALARRIRMIISPAPAPSVRLGRRTLVAVAGAGALVAAGVLFVPLSLESKPAVAPPPTSSPCMRGSGDRQSGLDRDTIHRVVGEHLSAFRRCYENFADPKPETRIEMHFTIGEKGNVTAGRVDAGAVPELGACAEPIMFRLVFPRPEGGDMTVIYPMTFAPG